MSGTAREGMAAKLLRIQTRLKAPKDRQAGYGDKFSYRSAEDIYKAVKPLLEESGCALTLTDEIAMVGSRFYVKATATLTDGAESVSATAYAREPDMGRNMDPPKQTGASSSYARKYAMCGLFLIDGEKDADSDEYTAAFRQSQAHPLQRELDSAAVELTGATTLDEVREVYQKHPSLANDPAFSKLWWTRWTELGGRPQGA